MNDSSDNRSRAAVTAIIKKICQCSFTPSDKYVNNVSKARHVRVTIFDSPFIIRRREDWGAEDQQAAAVSRDVGTMTAVLLAKLCFRCVIRFSDREYMRWRGKTRRDWIRRKMVRDGATNRGNPREMNAWSSAAVCAGNLTSIRGSAAPCIANNMLRHSVTRISSLVTARAYIVYCALRVSLKCRLAQCCRGFMQSYGNPVFFYRDLLKWNVHCLPYSWLCAMRNLA